MASERVAEVLNEFLREELSAVESYRQALPALNDPYLRARAAECLRSHGMRVDILLDEIDELGGAAYASADSWNGIAQGENAAIAALASGETQVLTRYRKDLRKLDIDTQELVEMELLPEQARTLGVIASLASPDKR